jgi:multicomponent Na+:H+ antiporter subunit A
MTTLFLSILAFPLLAGVIAPFFRANGAIVYSRLVSISMVAIAATLVWFAVSFEQGSTLSEQWEWIPSLGVSFSLLLDGFSLLMLILIIGIGGAIFAYASEYLHGGEGHSRFTAILLFFLLGMVGIVLSGNLIQLFVFWELTSITSYLLIGTKSESPKARAHALQALLVTGGGGVIMFLGFVLLGIIAGSYELQVIFENKEQVLAHPMLPWVVATVLLGALTKSGQFPFHFWLPNAMSAPTPVSAYLHSATMVKAGVILVAKLTPLFGGLAIWEFPLMVFGGITMIYAATLGLLQTDLKKILAYTTLSVLGLLMMLFGVGSELSIKAAIVFLFGHALYKSTLFMCAGSIDHAVHTRDVRLLGALRKMMPITALAAGLAALSKSGFPPFFGFLGKEYAYKSGIASEWLAPVVVTVALVTNMVLMALALKVGVHPFFRKIEKAPTGAHDPSWWMKGGPLLLASLGLLAGLFPLWINNVLVEPALGSVLLKEVDVTLKLWHGFNIPLLLSVLTLIGGILIYSAREKLWRQERLLTPKDALETLYEWIFNGTNAFAKSSTAVIQSGVLRNYLYWIMGSFAVLAFYKIIWVGQFPKLDFSTLPNAFDGIAILLIVSGAIYALIAQSRLVMLIALGMVGMGIALIYVNYSAPDLAITQILVETLIVLLFVFSIKRLSRLRPLSSKSRRLLDAGVATLMGTIVTFLILKSQWIQFAPPVSEKLVEWSYPLAKGKNVVNVILVDFRAMDTLGEITVLGIAALGVFVMMESFRKGNKKVAAKEEIES